MNIGHTLSEVIFSEKLNEDLVHFTSQYPKDKVFILYDENTHRLYKNEINKLPGFLDYPACVIEAGDSHKDINQVTKVWEFLGENGADRKSLLVNIAGGMPCDLGGFAASTFKRGINFINVPTTLLSQVDASVGGKTGINFRGLKNEIGVIKNPQAVLISMDFLMSLDRENFLSGWAEVVKHSLLDSEKHWRDIQAFDTQNIDYQKLKNIIIDSVKIKARIVEEDPTEQGIRKALNLGHTIGHAIESHAMYSKKALLHGYAVVYGLIAELYMSVKLCGFDTKKAEEIYSYILSVYGKYTLNESDFETLYRYMSYDKKNENNQINFTLLGGFGDIRINTKCEKELVIDSLKFYNSL